MIEPSKTITTAQLNEQILKYLKPEITLAPVAPGLIFGLYRVNSQAEGKFDLPMATQRSADSCGDG